MSKGHTLEQGWTKRIYGQDFAIELVQQLVIPTFVLDAECRVIVWNRACERLTGMAAIEVIGTREHWRAFYDAPRPCLADLIAQGRDGDVRKFYSPNDVVSEWSWGMHAENWCVMPLRDAELYLALDASPILDASGELIGVVETLRDMTDRKRTESELRLIASVFDNSQEGILMTDPDGRILDVNGAFTRVTGYTREEVIGQTPAILKSGVQESAFYKEMWRCLGETGQWQGEVWNRKKSGEVYPEILHINAVTGACGRVTHYIGMFTDITDLKSTQQRLVSLAYYDALTDLPNRVLLAQRLHQAMSRAKRSERLVAICFLDLDDFKVVNDRYGHEIGNRFLIETANRLLGCLGNGDTVARLGGDEFVLLVADLISAEQLEGILGKVFEAVAAPFDIGDIDIGVSASVGVTLYPLDDSDPDTLLRHADHSMYQAKQLGRNRYHLYDLDAAKDLQTRHRELERIRQALQHGEFRLHYQPKVNMRSGRVIGLEALIRWQHPEQGLLSPAAFLPQTEHSPLIVDIGEWVLHEVLAQMAVWALEGYELPVSVNIAARHFHHIDFVQRLQEILSEHPEVSPHLLELEILESAALEDVLVMREVMAACQGIGVSFALDDFGTGYSSLTYLKQLPAETIKIDKSFVHDMLDDQEDLAIIEGVIGLAGVFRKELIAEGVETAEHGLMLMRYGCDCAQGYGIGRPMPPEAVAEWVRGFEPDWKWPLWAENSWHAHDMPLLLAPYDYEKWIRLLQERVADMGGADSALELSDFEDCRLSRWYAGSREQYGDLPEFEDLAVLHERLHRVCTQIVAMCNSGHGTSAVRLCDELVAIKAEFFDKLVELQRCVVRKRAS
ncbi:EAL domain-containing protein [Imhoffiella purpurea]|uniref:Diguanylate cyclase n=1 Tax=Imhoffiella purpurea TaxID=1249627 RepID=W9V5L4_9GAMM|nr:EAL domain-containing protein [Imhoffiella purpurea]EXJ14659.1 diguanylate cyclase [Imhoffiella purpurea]